MSAFDSVLKKTISHFKSLQLTSAAPTPSGTDITDNGGNAIESGDLAIRDTNTHWFLIPMALSGWRRLLIGVINDATPHDQTISLSLRGFYNQATGLAIIASLDLPSGANQPVAIGEGAVGYGGQEGGGAASHTIHYDVPAINAGYPYIAVGLTAASAPSIGSLRIHIYRSS